MLVGQSNSSDMCLRGHVFVWAGDPNYKIPIGYPCACGQTKYSSVTKERIGVAKKDIKIGDVISIEYRPDGVIKSDWIDFK